MAGIRSDSAYDSLLNYLVEKATPEAILAFQISETEQEYIIELLDKQDEGTLTDEENAELELARKVDLLWIDLFIRARQAFRD